MSTITNTKVVTDIRVRTHRYMPYMAKSIYGMKIIERPGIGTMAVDAHNRCYYDPEFVAAHTLDENAYVLLHEALHVTLRHNRMMRALIGPTPSEQVKLLANIAVDLVVEQLLRGELEQHRPEGAYHFELMGFPPKLSAPEYFRLLMKDQEKQEGGKSPAEGHDGTPDACPPAGGSCADGLPRPYEEAPDESWESHGADRMLLDLEEAIERHENRQQTDASYRSKHPGKVPGMLKQSIGMALRPQPDPWDQLRSAVASSVRSSVGQPVYTYSRFSRRQQPDLPRLLGVNRTAPTACVILDTSYSMCNGEDQVRALTVIAQGLRKLSRFRVFAGDTAIQSDKRVSNIKQIEWAGGGGTDMARILEHVDAEHRPDSIVIITDGHTPWPRKKLKARVVAAITQPDSAVPPRWVRAVRVGGGA